MDNSTPNNHLGNTTSPYLLQHAKNPVEWYPWGEEALTRARQEDKPILLSIGYSACHWCHVMAHESFEDETTAKLMNENFINIKVDREERPDIDKVYQTAHQLLNQRGGGWPLTAFLSPDDLTPFYSGTYFPLQPRYGMPAFQQVLQKIVDVYQHNRAELVRQNQDVRQTLERMGKAVAATKGQVSGRALVVARQQLEHEFDAVHGGFGSAPKFPQLSNLEFLLQHWAETKRLDEADERALDIVRISLDKMAQGGIYDQLGGGFFRYSVDATWTIPHFEKMLYDNAQMLSIYAQAYAATANTFYADIINQTATWLLREMHAPGGGFYSTLDADSDGHEGLFYIWDPEQVKNLLSLPEYQVLGPYYGLDRQANFEDKWHLRVVKDLKQIARACGINIGEAQTLLQSGQEKLLQARAQRVRPGLDDKILTAWNALAIKGFALAGRYLKRPDFIAVAEATLDFIREQCWVNGRLLAVYKTDSSDPMKGIAYQPAYLDDYAFLLDAINVLLQIRWSDKDSQFANSLAEGLVNLFADKDAGGFYFTGHDQETLIHRPKPLMDEALTSGNGIAALALNRFGHLFGDSRYIAAAEHTLEFAWPVLQAYPSAHVSLLFALDNIVKPPPVIVIRGDAAAMAPWQQALMATYYPRLQCFAIPRDVTDLPAHLAARKPRLSCVVAYLCQGMQCSPPFMDLKELLTLLREG